MVRLKKEQRIFIIAKFAELKSVCLVQRAFHEQFAFSPDPKTIRAVFARFKNGGQIGDKQRTGRPKSVTTPHNVQQVRQVFQQNPKKSTRRAAAELGISRSSVRRILNDTKTRPFPKQSQGGKTSPRPTTTSFCHSQRSRDHAIELLEASFLIMSEQQPLNVLVTGAAGQIAYSLLYMLGKGDVFGPNQPITLRLLDIPPMAGVLAGVTMELQDCSLPLLRDVVATTNEAEAFQDVDAAFLVGSMPRKEGMERKDLLAANVKIFKSQGKALDQFSRKNVKVLVVGNPANTNALICSKYAPSIPKENISAMTRLDQNRAQAQVAAKLSIPNTKVKNVIIWGNHSSTQFPDAQHATAEVGGGEVPVYDAVKDDNYLQTEFISTVQKRGAAVIAARKLSSAMSAAKAACDHMRDWWHGTAPGTYVSMAVYSDGSYGVPADLMFSFPVTCSADRTWKIVPGLPISDFARSKLDITAKELVEEREDALAVCQD